MASCSVIIVSYYSGPVLFASLESILSQHDLAELIVVDNGNRPDIIARLQQMRLTQPLLKIISGHGNIGIAHGYNLGAKQAEGDYLLFTQPDCLIPQDALKDCITAFDVVPGATLAGCVMLNPDGSEHVTKATRLLTPKSAIRSLFEIKSKRVPAPTDETQIVEVIQAAFMCIKAKVFTDMGGFDEAFFLAGAELDLCMRVHRAGGKMLCVRKVKVIRISNASHKDQYTDTQWHNTKDYMHYFEKHFNGEHFLGTLLLIDIVLLVRYVALRLVERVKVLFANRAHK